MSSSISPRSETHRSLDEFATPTTIISIIFVSAALLYSYGGELLRLSIRWADADYAHGFLVIPFAFYLAWKRREQCLATRPPSTVDRWVTLCGLLLIFFAIAMQCLSAYLTDPVLTPLSLIPCLAGIALTMGGRAALAWLWPSLLILVFMVPLPNFMQSWGNLLLQRVSTVSSTSTLQALGVPAVSFGNVIVLINTELGVEEACSGLRSTVLFFAVSVGAALLIRGTPERIALILAAIPSAVLANIIRIVATGLLYQHASPELADAVFHDLFGFLMLPLAAAMAWGVVQVTRALFVTIDEERPLPL